MSEEIGYNLLLRFPSGLHIHLTKYLYRRILFISLFATNNLKTRYLRFSGRHKCREKWPNVETERVYNIFLDATLLLIPLIVMCLAYSLIAAELWRGLRQEIRQTSGCQRRRKYTGTVYDYCIGYSVRLHFNTALHRSSFPQNKNCCT